MHLSARFTRFSLSSIFSCFGLFCLAVASLPAQVVPGRYIVELSGQPAARFAARQGRRASVQDAAFRSRVETLKAQQLDMRRTLEQRGARVLGATHVTVNALSVAIADEQAANLAAIPGVLHVHPVRLYRALLDHALPLEKVPDAWTQIGGADRAGAGIKIGIIDTGIDVHHPAFQDATLTPPAGFPKVNDNADLIHANNKIIVARSYGAASGSASAQDDVGHGTGVAMTAAGQANTGPYGLITGVAPKAFLGSYKVFPNASGGAPTDLIMQAIDDAVADGMDVINLSLGSLPATRPADDVLVSAVENAFAAGVIVTIAAGNEGSDPDTIDSPGSAPSAITVGSAFNDRVFAGTATVAGLPPLLAIPGDGPNSATPISAPLVDVAQLDPSGLACGALPAGSLNGSIALILRGTCVFEQKIGAAQQAGAVAVLIYTDAARPDPITMAVGQATLPAEMVGFADGSALKQQIAAGPVSATLVFTPTPVTVAANRLSSFSSRGPNTDYGIKPDLIAVGSSISTARPVLNNGSATDGYVVESGTSFSSPMLAGAAALVKGARPGLTAQQYRSLLINTATPVITAAGAALPIQQEGAGLLNALAAITGTVAANPTSLSFGIGSNTLDTTKTLTITNLGAAADTFSILVQPSGSGAAPVIPVASVQLNPGQSQDIPVELAGSSLNPGSYQGEIQIQASQSAVVTAVPYWYGIPSQVAQYVTILEAPASGTAGTRKTFFFRLTDADGIPVTTQPDITVTSGGGSVLFVTSIDDQIPGAFGASVRLGRLPGDNVVHIELNGVSKDITIHGN